MTSINEVRVGEPCFAMTWCQDMDGVIGDGSRMLWCIPEDTRHFKELTRWAPVIMGRRTWVSLPPRNRPLPERYNIVLSGSLPRKNYRDGHTVARSLDEAFHKAGGSGWVIGGAETYQQAMVHPLVTRAHITEVDCHVGEHVGSTVRINLNDRWMLCSESEWCTSQDGRVVVGPGQDRPLRYRFLTYAKTPTAGPALAVHNEASGR